MKYKVGEIIYREEPIILNEGKETVEILVENRGDRSIQVGSHFHFFESNLALKFDREKTLGMRLDIPSGTAVRFEPGEDKRVSLVSYAGARKAVGFLGITMGDTTDPQVRERAFKKMKELEVEYTREEA